MPIKNLNQIDFRAATGLAPFAVQSTTKVTNLNADKWDDQDLPALTSNGGKVLAINSGATALEFISLGGPFVDLSSTDQVKIGGFESSNITGTNTGDQVSSTIPFSPNNGIVATNAQAAINEVNADVLAHSTNTANPHTTTADQVGAIKKDLGTAKGDLITFSAAATPLVLQHGTTNQVLTTLSTGGLGWANASDTVYTLPVATPTVLGGVKDGANLNIAADGTIALDPNITVTSITASSVTIGTSHKIEQSGNISIFRYIGA